MASEARRLVRNDSADPDHVPEKDASPTLNDADPDEGLPDISIFCDSVALETPRSAVAPPVAWATVWTDAARSVSDSLELNT